VGFADSVRPDPCRLHERCIDVDFSPYLRVEFIDVMIIGSTPSVASLSRLATCYNYSIASSVRARSVGTATRELRESTSL
jgi:hypothetical protein